MVGAVFAREFEQALSDGRQAEGIATLEFRQDWI